MISNLKKSYLKSKLNVSKSPKVRMSTVKVPKIPKSKGFDLGSVKALTIPKSPKVKAMKGALSKLNFGKKK